MRDFYLKMEEKTRLCGGICKTVKPIEQFDKDKYSRNGYRTICKKCRLSKSNGGVFICGIYKVTNPSGEVYIGQSEDIINRWKRYQRKEEKKQRLIRDSILKHGIENHTFEVIEECQKEDLNCRERYWQDFYDVLNNGLNCYLTGCGDLKFQMREDSQKIMSEALIGKNKGDKSYMAEPTINTQTMEIYVSAIEAFQHSNEKTYSSFVHKLKGSSKNNTHFMYVRDYDLYGVIEPASVKSVHEPVIDTYTKKEYKSITDAAKDLGMPTNSLSSNLNGKSINQTFCVYLKDYTGEIHFPEERRTKRVVNKLTDEVYESIADTCRILNISARKINRALDRGDIVEGVSLRYYEPETDWPKLIKYMYTN